MKKHPDTKRYPEGLKLKTGVYVNPNLTCAEKEVGGTLLECGKGETFPLPNIVLMENPEEEYQKIRDKHET